MNAKTPTSRPPKQPDQVRKRLFQAATTLLSEGQPVSIGAIASAAGVSKGAVQHHFGTKEQLLGALFDIYMEHFNEALASEEASAPPALRYARMSLNTTSYEDIEGWRAMVVATVMDRGLAARYLSCGCRCPSTRARSSIARSRISQQVSHQDIKFLALFVADLIGRQQIG
ncbi:MAG: TetR/AcrR family transcriptional regulator [Alcaligenaceae bacterium]|nr:MAG: TetR/AcrR family transcriptional regulator [Alcaligenaceae bacterium]